MEGQWDEMWCDEEEVEEQGDEGLCDGDGGGGEETKHGVATKVV